MRTVALTENIQDRWKICWKSWELLHLLRIYSAAERFARSRFARSIEDCCINWEYTVPLKDLVEVLRTVAERSAKSREDCCINQLGCSWIDSLYTCNFLAPKGFFFRTYILVPKLVSWKQKQNSVAQTESSFCFRFSTFIHASCRFFLNC